MAQYRAIFRNANLALFAALSTVAASVVSVAPTPAQAAILDWDKLADGTLDGTGENVLAIVGNSSSVNQNGFNLTLTNGQHFIKGNGSKPGVFTVQQDASISLNSTDGRNSPTLTIGESTENKTATVTINSFTNAGGTLNIGGFSQDATSELQAGSVMIGGKDVGEDQAVVNLNNFGYLNAFGGKGILTIADGAKIVIGENSGVTSSRMINMTGGKVLLNGTVDNAKLGGGYDYIYLNLTGGVIENYDSDHGGTIAADTLNLLAGGTINAKGDLNITAYDVFKLDGTNINVAEGKTLTIKNDYDGQFSAGSINVSGGTAKLSGNGLQVLALRGSGKIVLTGGSAPSKLEVDKVVEAREDFNLSIGSGAEVTFKKKASFAKGTLTTVAGSKIKFDPSNTTSILNVHSSDIKPMLGTTGAITLTGTPSGRITLDFNDVGTIDLGASGLNLVDNTSGKLTDVISSNNKALLIAGGMANAKFLGSQFDGDVKYAFKTFEVGSGAHNEKTFSITGGAQIEVDHSISAENGAMLKTLSVSSGSLTLDGSGDNNVVKASDLILNSSGDAPFANLYVNTANWSVSNLTLTKGQAEQDGDSFLNVGGTLSLANDSSYTLKAGTLSTVGAGKLDLSSASNNSFIVQEGASAVFDFDDIFKKDGAGANLKNILDTSKVKASAISGDGLIIIKSTKGESLSKSDYDDFAQNLANFKGFYNLNIDKSDIPEDLTLKDLPVRLQNDTYNNKTVMVSAGESLSANYSVGNVLLSDDSPLKLGQGGNLILTNASADKNKNTNNFVSVKTDAPFATAFRSVKLDNGLKTGGVLFEDVDNTLTLLGDGNIGSITASAGGGSKGTVNIGRNAKGLITATSANVVVKDTLNGSAGIGSASAAVKNLNIADNSSLMVESGDVYADSINVFANGILDVHGSVTTAAIEFKGKSLKADRLVFSDLSNPPANNYSGQINFNNVPSVVDVGTLSLGTNQLMRIGNNGTTGYYSQMSADKLVLKKDAIVYVGTGYMSEPSMLVVKDIANSETASTGSDTLKAKIGVGFNAALGIGLTNEEFKEGLQQYMSNAGGFEQPASFNSHIQDFSGVGNAVFINKPLKIDSSTGGILADAANANLYKVVNQVKLVGGSALVLTDKAFGPDKKSAAIQFTGTGGKIIGADVDDIYGSKIILLGDFVENDDLTISTSNGASSTIEGSFKVESLGGLLSGTLSAGSSSSVKLEINKNLVADLNAGISSPVLGLIMDRLQGKLDSDAQGYKFVEAMLKAKKYKQLDAAVHAATYAGAQQAAMASVNSMSEAILARTGSLDVASKSIIVTGSEVDRGVWLTPMYKSIGSEGFNAQGGKHGADIDMKGVTFGADTVYANMCFGATLNIGSGDSEGNSNGYGLKNEFDYYGLGVYSATNFGSFALVGDASFTHISHDVEGFDLNASTNTTALSMGLTGRYKISVEALDITPHIGARYVRLDTDSYDLSNKTGVQAKTDFDVQHVFSVPVGVTLCHMIESDGWTLAPTADFTITFNAAGTDAEYNTLIAGKKLNLEAEVIDDVAFSTTVGLNAQYGAFNTNVGINISGAENSNSFGLKAQASYMF